MSKLTRAIIVAFHKYTPFGDEFYQPIYDFFIQNLTKYRNEFDKLYLIDSNWNIQNPPEFAEVIKVNPHLRYYDAYKEVLPQLKQNILLFVDNDMVVYKKGIINATFEKLSQGYDIVSIYDTIGEKTFPQLNNKSKFCPYWFAAGAAMLRDFTNCDWGPNMPRYETLGQLTEKMLSDEIKPFEWEEDKSSLYFDGTIGYTDNKEKSKDLGYYHIRSGSVPAYLLATKKYGNIDTYNKYLRNQPKNEYLRQLAWYIHMHPKDKPIPSDIYGFLDDIGMEAEYDLFLFYLRDFKKYYGL